MNSLKSSSYRAIKFAAFLFILINLVACSSGGGDDTAGGGAIPGGSTAPTLSKRLRENFVNLVIIPLYTDLDNSAASLKTAVDVLKTNKSQTTLDAAKAAWIDTRIPWEQSEASLFGPADIFGIDPAIDSWPLSEGELKAVLKSRDTFSVEFINSLENTLKGFHAIEFILFGNGGTKTAGDLSTDEINYASALAQALKNNTSDLLRGWTTGIQGQTAFATEFLNAGPGNTTFPNEGIATEQVIRGMIGICTEVADGKIADPFDARDPNLVESQYSYNSTDDFANNIAGVKLIYQNALKELISTANPGLYARAVAEVDVAINAILAIPRPFRTAIQNSANDARIRAAQASIRQVKATLENDIIPLAQ